MSFTLYIQPLNEEVREMYLNHSSYHEGDCGVDLFIPYDKIAYKDGVVFFGHQIKCKMTNPNGEPCSYYLYARSSIAKTPLMLANSVGIIDSGYRGEIIAAFRHFDFYEYTKGQRLVQICAPNLGPIKIVVLDCELDETERGSGGFGSTGL
jgi:dUTP pyrophosphatase